MGLRRCASIMLCDATFSGYAGYWFLAIDTGVLFVCDSFTLLETELPFRDPRVWKSLGMQYNDNMAPSSLFSMCSWWPSIFPATPTSSSSR
jgi:hypothetical protein